MSRSVALLLQTLGNDYQELLKDDCLAAGRRLGFEINVLSAERSAERQLQQVRELLRQPPGLRPVAVLITPVRESTLMAAAHEALRTGLGWIVMSRWSEYLAEQRQLFPDVPLFCVMPDQEEIGRIQARQMNALLPDGVELVYIRGPLGTFSAERRWAGFRDEFDARESQPFLVNSDWSAEGGEQAMNEWLRIFSKRPLPACVVAAQNDAMAMGALKAFRARDKRGGEGGPLLVTGVDGSPGFGRRLVDAGELRATIVIPPVSGRALEELARLINGGPRPKLVNLVPVQSRPDLHTLTRART